MPALAFGPGLNVEGALLRACDGPVQSATAGGAKAAAASQKEASAERAEGKEEVDGGAESKAQVGGAVKRVAFDRISNNTGLM